MTEGDWGDLDGDLPVAGARWTPSPAASLRPARRRLLVGLGAIPWLALGVGLASRAGPSTAGASSAASPSPSAPTHPVVATASSTATPTPSLRASENAIPQRRDDRVTAVAIMALHHEQRGIGRYVDHAAVEQVLHHSPDAAVVVVRAAVLDPVDDHWSAPITVRRGVPVSFDGPEPSPAGPAWPLPDVATPVRELTVELHDDPALADTLQQRLTATGWRAVQIQALGRADRWPLVCEVVAIAPDSDDLLPHHLWFHHTADGWRLIGDHHTPSAGANP